MNKNLIAVNDCRIEGQKTTLIQSVSWEMNSGEAWLVIGKNNSGKSFFLDALAGKLKFATNHIAEQNGQNAQAENAARYFNSFENSVEIVSLERAAALIEEERANDESEYTKGGVDHGRSVRVFLCEALLARPLSRERNGTIPMPAEASQIDGLPEVKLCGIEKILDRGLKYLSTGEIRRTLLCRALLGRKRLLILSDPFAGLDAESRSILLSFFDSIAGRQLKNSGESDFPHIILGMERWNEIPDAISHVLEFSGDGISFCSTRADYEKIVVERQQKSAQNREQEKQAFKTQVNDLSQETQAWQGAEALDEPQTLVEMRDVNVGWGDKKVLVNLNWVLRRGEHWLLRGPNGSGKTTFLELITGDNMQVFCNDIKIFGARRGSGETIWDIKKRLGIVSYRLHVEYRMVGASLLTAIVSGFHDSIGLYEQAGDVEIAAAKKWLALGGFAGREGEAFNSLSYGEQRSILILRAAVKSPEILVLDEPCHGLDENARQKILDLLETIAESNTTTLLHVTHEASEVLECEKHILEFRPNEEPMYKIIVK